MTGGKKKMAVIVGVAVLVTVVGLLYFYRTQTQWVDSPAYERVGKGPAHTLVVVYSRTGNTLGVAKEIARFFDADLLEIEAPQYARNLKGQSLAANDADKQVTTTPIEHDPVDLSRYDLVFMVSPTWWFRPAPPLWSFAENHDFADKPVFLMMTGNSRLKDELTNKFGGLIEEKNGRFLDKLFIRRGRIYWQKTPDEVHEEVRNALKARSDIWPVTVSDQ